MNTSTSPLSNVPENKGLNMTETTNTPLNLRSLKVGQLARVIRVNAQGELGRRIRDMGLIPGAEIQVVGRAPLKDPVALRIQGFTLTLRNNEADHITVEVDGG